MLTKLLAAEEALTKEETIEKADLEDLINYAKAQQSKEEYKYLVPVVKERFEKALAEAETIYGKADATQEEVDAAYNALQNAIFGLRLIPDKDKLDDLIKEAEKTDFEKYTEESGTVLRTAIANAKAVFADENATETDVKNSRKRTEDSNERA